MRRLTTVLLLLVLGTTTRALAQQGPCPMKGDGSTRKAGVAVLMDHGMMDHGMMVRMDSLDARLDSLTKVMASASGTRKIDAMSAVLGALVTQHRAMHHMMHERMMEKMGMSDMCGPPDAMSRAGCPCTPAAKADSAGSHD